ncbi:methylosome subunit pICln [Bacillus rossius redtenbacheri]|uniref:methylosome subunit pICln n=1 Tax=Bacillus rossius redtenbacheri TaxID=93214 RepID=UPI002FDCEC35
MVVLSSFPPPSSGIKCEQPLTKLFINEREIGTGTLYIATSHLSWVDGVTGKGISVQYEHITLHAVSKDFNIHPDECLYLMLDTQIEFAGDVPGEDESEDECDESGMTEIRFVPDDKASLQAMFTAMSQCQALHPDPVDSLSEDDEIFEDAEEEGDYDTANLGGGDGPSVPNGVEHGEHQPTVNGDNNAEPMEMDGQFEDADE